MDYALANRMIEMLSGLTNYNISIIDENGKVIASKIKAHIGAFHETAFEIIKGTMDTITVNTSDPESGIEEGVYMALYVNKCKTGVIGVYGNPREVMSITSIIKMSLEVMLEFELYKSNNMRKYTIHERFMRTIFYSNDFERSDLEKYLKDMNMDEHAARLPVLLEVSSSPSHISEITKILKNNPLASRQDLIGITNENDIFLLKSIQCDVKTIMQDYKYLLGEYLSATLNSLRTDNLPYRIYIGPIQNDIMQYRQAFLYCKWMQKNINKSGSYYFYDYIVKYLESMASQNEYNSIFLYLKQELGPKFINTYVEIMGALIENDYNLTKTGASLHIRKNTLVYHLNKIREILNMNPLASNPEREFMECFYFYLNRNHGKNTD